MNYKYDEIPPLEERLREDFEDGKISAREIAEELLYQRRFNYPPSDAEALQYIGVKSAK